MRSKQAWGVKGQKLKLRERGTEGYRKAQIGERSKGKFFVGSHLTGVTKKLDKRTFGLLLIGHDYYNRAWCLLLSQDRTCNLHLDSSDVEKSRRILMGN